MVLFSADGTQGVGILGDGRGKNVEQRGEMGENGGERRKVGKNGPEVGDTWGA